MHIFTAKSSYLKTGGVACLQVLHCIKNKLMDRSIPANLWNLQWGRSPPQLWQLRGRFCANNIFSLNIWPVHYIHLQNPNKVNKYTLFLQFIVIIYTSCFCLFQYLRVSTILITFHILILFGTNKWAYTCSVICQFWPMFSLNFFLASRKYVHYLHYYLAEQHMPGLT